MEMQEKKALLFKALDGKTIQEIDVDGNLELVLNSDDEDEEVKVLIYASTAGRLCFEITRNSAVDFNV